MDTGIGHGRVEAAVAEESLNGGDIGSGIDQLRTKGVPEHMRCHLKAQPLTCRLKAAATMGSCFWSYIYRMLTPDEIVPDPANPQSYNRYSYVYNNPINFTDPSGHCAETGDDGCWSLVEQVYRNYFTDWAYLSSLSYDDLRLLNDTLSGAEFEIYQRGSYFVTNNLIEPIGFVNTGSGTPFVDGGELFLDSYMYLHETRGMPIPEKLGNAAPIVGPILAIISGANEYVEEGKEGFLGLSPAWTGAGVGFGKDMLVDKISESVAAGAVKAGASANAGFGVYLACQLFCEATFDGYVDVQVKNYEMVESLEVESPILRSIILNNLQPPNME